MFAQKILSLVSILLLGSLTTVKATIAVLPDDCPDTVFDPNECTTTGRDHNSYCVHGLNVYSITIGNECRESVLTLTANTVNVIDTSSSPALASTGIADLVTANNIALVDCGASSCSQTFGYFKSTEDPSEYYRIGADGTNQVVVTVDGCNGNIGSLFTDKELCITNTNSEKVDFGTDANYLIKDDIGVFTSAGANVVVASRTNSITTVNIGENSYLVTDKAGLLNGNAEDVLVVKLNIGNIEVDTSFNGQDFCVDEDWAIYKRTDGLCLANVDGEDCTLYYDCNAGKSCTVSDSNRNPCATCIPTAGTKCGAGYFLVKGGNALSTDSGVLWQCFGNDGDYCQNIDSDHQIGFLVNAGSDDTNTKYIQCTDTTGSCTIAPIGDECVATETVGKATYGQLYTEDLGNNYQLCLYDGTEKSITIGATKKYLIEKRVNILGFAQDTVEATKYVVLEVDASQNILPVANTAVGYYSTTSATSYEVVTLPTEGVTLYSCAADTNGLKCGQVTSNKPIGYLKNQDDTGSATYIYCPKSGTCNAIAVTGTSCAETASGLAVTTGSLHSDNKFCVYNSGDKSIELTGMYFVSAATDLFGLTAKVDSFIVVKLDEQGNFTVVKESPTPVRYRYTLTADTQNKIHTRAQAKTEISSGEICGNGTPKEFTMIQWTSSDIEADKNNADYYIATPTN